MPIDPTLAAGVQPVQQANPLSTISTLMQLKDQQAQASLRALQGQQAQAATANLQAEADQKNAENKAYTALGQKLADPAVAGRVGAGNFTDIDAMGLDPRVTDKLKTNILTQQKTQIGVGADQMAANETKHKAIADSADGLLSLGDDDAIAAAYPGTRANLISEGVIKPETFPASISGAADLKLLMSHNNLQQGINRAAMARQGEQQKLATDASTAGKNTADANQAQSAADLSNYRLALMKGSQQDQNSAIDGVIDPQKYPAQNAQAKNMAAIAMKYGGPEAAQKAIQDVYGQIADVQKSNMLIPGEVSKAVQIENATSPAKIAQQVAAARAMRAGDNPAVANVPPAAVIDVQHAAMKADADYATAQQAANEMSAMTTLARSGNKVAYAYSPVTGVLTINAANGSKRVNLNEINAYEGAGSDFDKVKQFFGKHLEGHSIDSDILNAMDSTHQALLGTEYQKYTGTLNSLNKRTGSAFQPTYDAPTAAHVTAADSATVGAVIPLPNGKYVKKTGANSFIPTDAQGNPVQ